MYLTVLRKMLTQRRTGQTALRASSFHPPQFSNCDKLSRLSYMRSAPWRGELFEGTNDDILRS
jgi:hypothetical protein